MIALVLYPQTLCYIIFYLSQFIFPLISISLFRKIQSRRSKGNQLLKVAELQRHPSIGFLYESSIYLC